MIVKVYFFAAIPLILSLCLAEVYKSKSVNKKEDVTATITVNITADNILDFYADGIYKGSHNNWQTSVSFYVPVNTHVYAVRGEDLGNPFGIISSTSQGELTGTDWRCTTTEQEGWTDVGFDDSSWPQAVIVIGPDPDQPFIPPGIHPDAPWIWTVGLDPVVYCRKTRSVSDPCESFPCFNGGQCIATIGENGAELGYRCKCLPYYAGERCKKISLKQVAAADCGATCTASSASSGDYICSNALDGSVSPGLGNDWVTDGEGVGAWIRVDFDWYYRVTGLMLLQRCAAQAQLASLTVQLSSGQGHQLELLCQGGVDDLDCSDQVWQRFDLPQTISDHIRLQAASTCSVSPTGLGLREVKVFVYDAPLANVGLLTNGASCSASSELDPQDYGCHNALDGVDSPGPGNEWASAGEGHGVWIQIQLNATYTVLGIGFLQRCDQAEQNKFLRLNFTDSSEKNLELSCFNTGQSPTECTGQWWQHFDMEPAILTNLIRVEITFVCTQGNNGFRQIRVFALTDHTNN